MLLRSFSRPITLAALILATLLPMSQASADDPIADVVLKSDSVLFVPRIEVASLVLTVSSPCGIVIRKEYDGQDTPNFALEELGVENLDGTYKYRLEQVPFLSAAELDLIADLRKNGDANDVARNQTDGRLPKPAVSQSGVFVVTRGAIITETSQPEKSAAASAEGLANETGNLDFGTEGGLQGLPQPDILHNDDVIIFRSLCVGFDCVNGEVFNADTIRLKENNLRIHFEDTSSASGFPTTDWRLIANDQASGGGSYFSIQDASANRRVFSVEANAPSHSLYVDNGGRVGIRTSNPVVDLHVSDGDTPTLRLEQTGASGFAPQTWDVAGNETSFFIRDATNGSTLPFRIRPGAASNSLVIDTDNDIGVGVLSPDGDLHVKDTAAGDHTDLVLESPAEKWTIRSNANSGRLAFIVNDTTTTMVIDESAVANLVTIGTVGTSRVDINGTLFLNGTQVTPDYVFEPSYKLESIEEHSEFMWANRHLPAVAPAQVNPDGKTVIEVGARSQGMLEELEKAHIYIEQLNDRLKTKEAAIVSLTERLQKLEAALTH